MTINKFDQMMLEIERELLDLKTAKQTASPLVNFVSAYQDTTSTTGTHYRLTYGDGNEPIFATFTSPRTSVIYVFRTPTGNTQLLDVYDLASSASTVFAFASTRPIISIEKL